jgi:hypothetical protein
MTRFKTLTPAAVSAARVLPLLMSAWLLTFAGCAPGPEGDEVASRPPSPSTVADPLRTADQAVTNLDLTRFSPAIIAWVTATRTGRHALADAFYTDAYAPVVPVPFVRIQVTSNLDSGPGTLRAALETIQASQFPNTFITFDPSVFGRGLPGSVIRLQSPLPTVGPFFPGGVITVARVIIVAPEPGAVVLDGDSNGDEVGDVRLMDWAGTSSSFFRSLTLVGLELRNGRSPSALDSGVVSSGGEIIVVDCWVHDNRTETSGDFGDCGAGGGNIRQTNSSATEGRGLVVFRSVFERNHSDCEGGAISMDDGLIAQSIFLNNTSAQRGGAIYQWQSINRGILFDSTTLVDNTAGTAGGAVFLNGRFIEFTQSHVLRNQAPVSPDIAGSFLNFRRSAVGQPLGTLANLNQDSFFSERAETVSARLRATDQAWFPWLEPLFCSAAIDLGDPADDNRRSFGALERPFDLQLGPPAVNLTDAGAVDSQQAWPPCLYVPPAITGLPQVNALLTLSTPETWRHLYGTTAAPGWVRCTDPDDLTTCTPIGGASGLTLTVGEADIGRWLRYSTSADNQVDEATGFSNAIGPVAGIAPTPDGPISLTGTPERCTELTLELPSFSGLPAPQPGDITIVWESCAGDVCTEVARNTRFFVPGPDDVGRILRVTVRVTTAAGTLVREVSSVPVASVPPPACTLTRLEADGPGLEVTGQVTASGSCAVAAIDVTLRGARRGFPGGFRLPPDGRFTTLVPAQASGTVTVDCTAVDRDGVEGTTPWTATFGECTTGGACEPVTRDCTVAANEAGTCGPAADACQASTCQAGACVQALTSCDDANPCTDDTCDPVTGCASVPHTRACDDGDLCTQGDVCSAGACVPGPPLVCTSEDVCLTATCSPTTGACVTSPVPDGVVCADTDLCDGEETCQAGVCTDADAPLDCGDLEPGPCEATACDPDTGCSLVVVEDGAPCATDTLCGGACAAGLCEGGVPLSCESDDPCLAGRCDPATRACVFDPVPGCGEDVGPGADAGGTPDAGTDAGPGPDTDVPTPDAGTPPDAGPGPDTDVPTPDAGTPPDAGPADAPGPSEDTAEEPGQAFLSGTGLAACASAPLRPSQPLGWLLVLLLLRRSHRRRQP